MHFPRIDTLPLTSDLSQQVAGACLPRGTACVVDPMGRHDWKIKIADIPFSPSQNADWLLIGEDTYGSSSKSKDSSVLPSRRTVSSIENHVPRSCWYISRRR